MSYEFSSDSILSSDRQSYLIVLKVIFIRTAEGETCNLTAIKCSVKNVKKIIQGETLFLEEQIKKTV
jgi:hypothetical protein